MTVQNDDERKTVGDLLIIHPGALGDVVAMFGLIAELKNRFDRLTMVCRPSVGYLATKYNLIDRSISHEAGYWALLYGGRPDNRAIELLTGHRRVILFSVSQDFEDIINTYASVPCVRVPPRPPPPMQDHVTRFAAKTLIKAGLIGHIPSLRETICQQAGTQTKRSAASLQAPILLHLGAGSPRKRWPVSSFLEVASKIISTGGNPEIIIGPAERDLLETPLPPGIRVHVLREMAELLQVLKPAAGFIGNDSGVAHLAACLGLPTVVIFTASDPRRWHPNGPAVAALSPALPCQPCFETQDANCPQPECLKAVTPDTVLKSFFSLCKEQIDDRCGK